MNLWTENDIVIKVDEKENAIGTLIKGQFLIHDINPAEHKVWGESSLIDTPEILNFEEGKTYYFRYISRNIPFASRT